MDYKEKVAFLRQYRDSLRREQIMVEELEELRSRAEGLTRVINGMPGAPSDGSALPRAVERILDAQNKLEEQIEACLVLRSQAILAISAVQDEMQREVLRRRYILGQRFETIAEGMGIVTRRVYQLHRLAVNGLDL